MVEKRVQNIEEIRAYKKVRLKKVFFLLHILLILWYSRTNSGTEGQKSYRSVLPRCYSKKNQEILTQTTPCVKIKSCSFTL